MSLCNSIDFISLLVLRYIDISAFPSRLGLRMAYNPLQKYNMWGERAQKEEQGGLKGLLM